MGPCDLMHICHVCCIISIENILLLLLIIQQAHQRSANMVPRPAISLNMSTLRKGGLEEEREKTR